MSLLQVMSTRCYLKKQEGQPSILTRWDTRIVFVAGEVQELATHEFLNKIFSEEELMAFPPMEDEIPNPILEVQVQPLADAQLPIELEGALVPIPVINRKWIDFLDLPKAVFSQLTASEVRVLCNDAHYYLLPDFTVINQRLSSSAIILSACMWYITGMQYDCVPGKYDYCLHEGSFLIRWVNGKL